MEIEGIKGLDFKSGVTRNFLMGVHKILRPAVRQRAPSTKVMTSLIRNLNGERQKSNLH